MIDRMWVLWARKMIRTQIRIQMCPELFDVHGFYMCGIHVRRTFSDMPVFEFVSKYLCPYHCSGKYEELEKKTSVEPENKRLGIRISFSLDKVIEQGSRFLLVNGHVPRKLLEIDLGLPW